ADASAIVIPLLDGSVTKDAAVARKVDLEGDSDFELLPRPNGEVSRRCWPASGRSEIVWPRSSPGIALPDGIRYTSDGHDLFTIVEGDPISAEAVSVRRFSFVRQGVAAQVEAHGRMSCTSTEFVLEHGLEVADGDRSVVSKRWELRVPRNGV
ncbi:MAG TPA: hypothetical protein VKU92_10575, partial [Acidimicrobiales bacterium]|nr:hypothetical protein [Acidimicrobiales bacterium]